MTPRWLHWPAAWTPAELGSLRAWYDASDTSTVTESSNLITAWNDKSGGGYHLSASGGARPTYTSGGLDGKHVVTFGGSQWIDASTAGDWVFLHHGSAGSHVVAVWKAGTSANPGGGSPAQYGLLSTQSPLGANLGASITYRNNLSAGVTDSLGHFTRGSGWVAVNISTSSAHPANTATILSVLGDPGNGTAANRSIFRVDGGSEIKTNSTTNTASSSNPTAALRLGATGSDNPLDGYIAEVVIANAKLSDADRDKVEGYLAHKWGLEGNLPIGHPYENAAP